MDFRIDSIGFSNFRCFSDAELRLNRQLTVLVADNGHGKSATLDALAICLGQVLGAKQVKPRTPVADRLQIQPSDATTAYALPPYRQSSFPVEIEVLGMVDEEPARWRGTSDEANATPAWSLPASVKDVVSKATLTAGADVTLPVFAYYGTGRTVASVVQASPPVLGRPTREFGYQNALRAGEALRELGPWLAQGEWERSGRGSSIWDSALDAVYEASTRVLGSHGVTRVSYSMEDRDLVLDFGQLKESEDGVTPDESSTGSSVIPMRLAADGYRSVLGMAADLAFRCGVLNAHLEGEAPQLTSGVVLIDEIDMHLHPSWQARVLTDIAQAFPRIQFVVTTHSPFVLSSVSGRSIRRIESVDGRSMFAAPRRTTEGARVDLLAQSVMSAPTRAPSPLVDILERLAQALRDRDLATAQRVADEMLMFDPPIEDEDATRLLLELEWRLERAQDADEAD